MQKTVIILRHGDAERGAPGKDHARRLTARGTEEARRAGAGIAARGLAPRVALVSDAARAVETFRLAAGALDPPPAGKPERRFYLAPHIRWLEAIGALPDHVDLVLLVGHNPGLSDLATDLAGRPIGLGTGDGVVVALEGSTWPDALVSFGSVERLGP